MRQIAVSGLHLYCVGFLLAGVNTVLSQAMAAVEQPRQSLAISLSRGLVVIVAFVLLGGLPLGRFRRVDRLPGHGIGHLCSGGGAVCQL